MAVQIEEMNGRKKTTGWGLQTVPVQSNCKAIPLCYTSLRSGGQTSQSGFHNVLTPGCYYQFNFNKWKYLIAIFHFMPALTWWEDKKPQISQDIKYDPNHRAAQSRVVCCLGWYLEREGLPVAIWHQSPLSRRISRREKPFLVLKEYETLSQFSHTYPANTDQDSSGVDISLPFSAVTYWIMRAQYFTLTNLNLKLQFSAKASFSLLLTLPALCGQFVLIL